MSILILGAKKPPTCFDCRHFGLMTTLYSAGMRCPYSTRIIRKDEFDESSGAIEGCPIIDVDYCFERAKKREELMMRIKAVRVDLDESLKKTLEEKHEKEEPNDGRNGEVQETTERQHGPMA